MSYSTSEAHRGVSTSVAAAARIAPVAGRLRAIVHQALYEHPAGLTVDEVCAVTGYPRYSLQPRFSEMLRSGTIRDTGRRRQNKSGAFAAVWRATVLDRQEQSS